MNDLRQIYAAENRLNFCNVEVLILLEDHYFWMIVEGERLLGGLIVDHNRPKRWIRFEHRGEIVSELPLEGARLGDAVTPDDLLIFRTAKQFTIIQCREWIAFRQTRDLSVLVIGGNEEVICIVEDRHKAVQLIKVIGPIYL